MEHRFRVAYEPYESVGVKFEEPSMTEQSHQKACDVQRIVRQFERGNIPLDSLFDARARFEDVSIGFDYHEAVNMVKQAELAFLEIPARIRAEFDNDPQAFSAFISDPANLDKMRELGLEPPAEQVSSPANDSDAGAEPAVPGGAPAPETPPSSAEGVT